MSLLENAIEIATELHEGQTRKGSSVPYIRHPLAVMEIVRDNGGSEVEQAAAVCHDTAEDSGGLAVLERLRRELGDEVAAIVEGCSDSLQAMGEEKAPWQVRKDAYVSHVRTHASRSRLLVSCADKLDNARAIVRDLRDESVGAAVWDRFKAGRRKQLWYYGSLSRVFLERLPGPLSSELRDVVADMEAEAHRVAAAAGKTSAA